MDRFVVYSGLKTVTIPQDQDVKEGDFSINFLFVSEWNVLVERFGTTLNLLFVAIKKKHGQNFLNVVRKYEQLLAKFMKLQADIKFIKTCKKEYLVPTFANVKLATRSGSKNLKLRLSRIIMEAEL